MVFPLDVPEIVTVVEPKALERKSMAKALSCTETARRAGSPESATIAIEMLSSSMSLKTLVRSSRMVASSSLALMSGRGLPTTGGSSTGLTSTRNESFTNIPLEVPVTVIVAKPFASGRNRRLSRSPLTETVTRFESLESADLVMRELLSSKSSKTTDRLTIKSGSSSVAFRSGNGFATVGGTLE